MDKKVLIAHSALFIVGAIYGLNYLIAKDVMNGFIEPRGFIFIRVLGALVLFWLFTGFKNSQKIERKDYWRIAVCGLTGVALNQTLFFEGLNLTTPINASIIMTSSPVIVLLLSTIAFKEKLTLQRVLGIALGAGGAIYLIAGSKEVNFLNSGTSLGNLLIFGNAISYSIYLILVKPLLKKYKSITVIKWVFFAGFIYMLPIGTQQFVAIKWDAMSWIILLEVAFVVIFTTFIAYLFNLYALKFVSSTTASFYIYLQPIFATAASVLLHVDALTLPQVFAALLIFSGVYMVGFSRKKNKTV